MYECIYVYTNIVAFFLGLNNSYLELNELAVFKESYASLCNAMTDINDLLKYFVTEKIITMDEQEEIRACITKSEKVSKLLINISGPLAAGDSKGFYTMLMIMKTYGTDATRRLADHIISRVENLKPPHLANTNLTNSIPKVCTEGLLIY